VARFEEALIPWRGIPELPDGRRGLSEKTRWIEGHAALVEDRADALLATGRAGEVIGDLEAAVAEAPLRERRWGQLMLALYRAGRQGEALGAYQRARSLLADELGGDPGPELRRLEAAIVAQGCLAGYPCGTTPSIGDARRDFSAHRHRGIDRRLGGGRDRQVVYHAGLGCRCGNRKEVAGPARRETPRTLRRRRRRTPRQQRRPKGEVRGWPGEHVAR
jgi:tetratricopeptide (TPR) repeat protein